MFPNDATTEYSNFVTTGSKVILASSTRTMLNIHVTNTTASSSIKGYCGSVSTPNEFFDVEDDYPDFDLSLNRVCGSEVRFSAPAGTKVYITSVPYDRTVGKTVATTTDILLVPEITAGETILSIFLFLAIMLYMGELLAKSLNKVQTKKRFLGYSGGDVEIRSDL